jgi:CRISPR-associated protein Csm2
MTEAKSGLNVSNELEKIIEIVERNKKGKGNKKQEKDRKEETGKIDKKEEKKEEKKEIDNNYDRLISEVIKDIEKGILNLDLEEYIKPGGICEGIAGAVGYKGKLKRSQLRKFFNEIKTIEYDLRKEEKDIKEIKIKILALIPKLAYSKGRDLIDDNFYDFMKTILVKVKEDMNKENAQEVFEVFVKILESIVAYHTYHFPKEA